MGRRSVVLSLLFGILLLSFYSGCSSTEKNAESERDENTVPVAQFDAPDGQMKLNRAIEKLCNSFDSNQYLDMQVKKSCEPSNPEAYNFEKTFQLLSDSEMKLCRKFLNFEQCKNRQLVPISLLGEYGKVVYDAVGSVQESRRRTKNNENHLMNQSLDENSLKGCPNYPSFNEEEKKLFWVWTLMGLSFGESTCNPNAVAKGVNQMAYGLCQMEGDPEGFRPDWCHEDVVGDPKKNLKCAVAVLNDFFNGKLFADNVVYFERLKGCRKSVCQEKKGNSCETFDKPRKIGNLEFTLTKWIKSYPPCYQGAGVIP